MRKAGELGERVAVCSRMVRWVRYGDIGRWRDVNFESDLEGLACTTYIAMAACIAV